MHKHQNSGGSRAVKTHIPYSTKIQELALRDKPNSQHSSKRIRNSGKRTSAFIAKQHAENFVIAIENNAKNGLPPNVHKTLNLTAMGIKDEVAVNAIGYWVKLMRDWMRLKGYPLVWYWVRENPSRGGSHVHLFMHLPKSLSRQLRSRQYYWLKLVEREFRSFKPRNSAGRILTKRIGGTLETYKNNIPKYRENLKIVVGYVLKGASTKNLRALGIKRQHVDCGVVTGKRIGRCQANILSQNSILPQFDCNSEIGFKLFALNNL